jgi:hypothetical protein
MKKYIFPCVFIGAVLAALAYTFVLVNWSPVRIAGAVLLGVLLMGLSFWLYRGADDDDL